MDEIEALKIKVGKLQEELLSEQNRIAKVNRYLELYLVGHPQPPLTNQEKSLLEMIQSYLND